MENKALIEALNEKVGRILSDNEALRAEVGALVREREKLSAEKREAQQRVLQLEKRVRVLETAGGFLGTKEDHRAARLRVNKLLREIDGCIALMNR